METKIRFWTVGLLHDPQPEELLSPFETLPKAENAAMIRADCDEKSVVGIWDQDSEVVFVYTHGLKLVPV